MDMTIVPNNETLIFLRAVLPWVSKEIEENGGTTYFLKKNTPDYILELFEEIKSEVEFKIN